MKTKYAIMILALPALSVLALLLWSLGYPLFACLSEDFPSLMEYVHWLVFLHGCIFLFGLPAYVWIPVAFTSFGIGAWLLLSTRSRNRGRKGIALGVVLSLIPVAVLSLAPFFGEYRGP